MMFKIGTNTLPVRSFSSVPPNVAFIDHAKAQSLLTIDRTPQKDMKAFNYVMNVYHVNNASGIEDITRYSELPHVLLASGSTYCVHPYWGNGDSDSYWLSYVWSKLYDDETDDEMESDDEIESDDEYALLRSYFPSDRTYIDIVVEPSIYPALAGNFQEPRMIPTPSSALLDGSQLKIR